MPDRSHKRWVPCIKAGEQKPRPTFWNPWPDRKHYQTNRVETKDGPAPEARPYSVGDHRARDCDIAGPLAKRGEPFER
jgi:hypothetical protein